MHVAEFDENRVAARLKLLQKRVYPCAQLTTQQHASRVTLKISKARVHITHAVAAVRTPGDAAVEQRAK